MGDLEYRIKFATHEPDLVVLLHPSDTCEALKQKVREHKQLPFHKHVRIICSGKELYADDLLKAAGSRVLHCIITDVIPQGPPQPRKTVDPPPAALEQPPVDWLDVVDPATILMWIFGSILALLWLLFIFYAHMFDRTSVIILCMMSVAFLVPCVLSYLPWLSFLQPQPELMMYAPGMYNAPLGYSTAYHAGRGPYQRHPNPDIIPPRPRAQVRPGM